MKKNLLVPLFVLAALIGLSASISPQALVQDSDSDSGRHTWVFVRAVYDDGEMLAISTHQTIVYSIPAGEIIEAKAVLYCPGETHYTERLYTSPDTSRWTVRHACLRQTPYADARTYTLLVVNAKIDANAFVSVP